MSSFSLERRDPCFGLCVASVACAGLLWKSRFTVGAERGAERPENRVERSGAVSGRCRKTMERSGSRSGESRSGNGAGSGGYRIRLERGAAFSPAPLRSHALVFTQRNFVADFLQEKCEFIGKTAVLRFWAPFGDLGSTYDDHLRLVGKLVWDFLLVLIELFSLGIMAEALRAIMDSKSAISLQRVPVDPKFQVEGVAPYQPFSFSEN